METKFCGYNFKRKLIEEELRPESQMFNLDRTDVGAIEFFK